jgi:hypothetical protein
MTQHEGARVMKSNDQDDAQQSDNGACEVALVDGSSGMEPNLPSEVHCIEIEENDLTGRAYEYFHKLQ